jgi:hypothetical protein
VAGPADCPDGSPGPNGGTPAQAGGDRPWMGRRFAKSGSWRPSGGFAELDGARRCRPSWADSRGSYTGRNRSLEPRSRSFVVARPAIGVRHTSGDGYETDEAGRDEARGREGADALRARSAQAASDRREQEDLHPEGPTPSRAFRLFGVRFPRRQRLDPGWAPEARNSAVRACRPIPGCTAASGSRSGSNAYGRSVQRPPGSVPSSFARGRR